MMQRWHSHAAHRREYCEVEIGVYSFGDVQRLPEGGLGSTSEAIRNLLEAIQLADQVGLDFFGVGEHHTLQFPASSPPTILAAAAATTRRIKLGSSVVVLSTDDPVRVFQQFATVDAISRGRAEIIAGRGSSIQSFPLFGYDLADYDQLYAEKLDLLLKLNETTRITWNGRFRNPLKDALVVPRPHQGRLKIWLATGGNPESSLRAGTLGLPISYAIIGGHASRFVPLATLYRRAYQEGGKDPSRMEVSVASPGFIARDAKAAKDTFFAQWSRAMESVAEERGWAVPTREHFDYEANKDGALFAGSPEEIAERIVVLHRRMGHARHFLQMDLGQLPHGEYLAAIELLGTRVLPLVKKEVG